MTSPDQSATRTSRPSRPAAPQAGQAGTRQVSRQREAGEVTRRETRRRLLAAAAAEFAERGYAAATVSRIAGRAGVSVQSLYNDWGNKRNLLEAVLQTAVTGDDEASLTRGEAADSHHRYPRPRGRRRSPPPRWRTSPASTGCSPSARRSAGRPTGTPPPPTPTSPPTGNGSARCAARPSMPCSRGSPTPALRPGLSPAVAADTAWAIASPETHHQLVRQAGYGYDELEEWVRTTLSAALFPDQ